MGRKLVNKFQLSEELSKHIDNDTGIILIGTKLVWWDKTAPIVGTLLTEKYNIKNVLGTYDNPVHALNLVERIKNIKHNNILAIDSCVAADNKKVGDILFGKDMPVIPGAYKNKKLPHVGNNSILAITIREEDTINNYKKYGSVKEENIIRNMAIEIAFAINKALSNNMKNRY